MTVLVTGGAGFIGSHLVDRLSREGERVVVIDDLSTGTATNLAAALNRGGVRLIRADVAMPLSDLRALLQTVDTGRLSAIFHLASPASPEAYGARPWETMQVNGCATMALCTLAGEHKADFFFASTSEVYGDPLVHPQPETYFGNVDPIGPRACYDEGKRFGEAAISVAARTQGLRARIVRLFNCYGPRMDIGDGRLIPGFLKALQEREPLPIHGDGRQTRSMTYIDDIIDGLLIVARHPATIGAPVNLGSEEEATVLEIAEAFSMAAGRVHEVCFFDARAGDPQRRKPDTVRAKSLGWSATTPLREGLRKTVEWFQTADLTCA